MDCNRHEMHFNLTKANSESKSEIIHRGLTVEPEYSELDKLDKYDLSKGK